MRTGLTFGLSFVLAIFAGSVLAQGFGGSTGPSEVPPASYTSSQYVDSQGCVFIRAGRSGVVRWVPRVSRNRQQMCGYRPSLSAGQRTVTVAPQTSVTAPVRGMVQTQQVPQTRGYVQVPQTQTTQQTRGYYQSGTNTNTRRTTQTTVTCQGASAISQQYINQGGRRDVRCGPQQISPTGYGQAQQQGTRGWSSTRGTSNAQQTVRVVRVPGPQYAAPQGYKPVWTDGRLNPMRGIGTQEGQIRTGLLWTDTVPRRLVHRETGRDVTYRMPGLSYPYLSYQQQYQATGSYYSR